jgi:molecular chaperone DnaK
VVSVVKDAMKGENVQRIRQTLEQLSRVATRIGEGLSRASSTTTAQTNADDSGVVDAEFEEVDGHDRNAG